MNRVIDDHEVLTEVIEPAGGIARFRLIRYPQNSTAIEYECSDGTLIDLVLEEDGMAEATIAYLERAGGPEIDWRDPSRLRKSKT